MWKTPIKNDVNLITIVCGISLFVRETKKNNWGCEVCDNNTTQKNPAGIIGKCQGSP